ncbi:MAG: hypothetical protein WCX88_01140 [Patescibacteria group bacterium]
MLAEKDLKRELANKKNSQKIVSNRRLASLRNRKPGIVSDVFDQLDSQEFNDFDQEALASRGSLNEFGTPEKSPLDAGADDMEKKRDLDRQRIGESRKENLPDLNQDNQKKDNKDNSLEKSENDQNVENEKEAARKLKEDKEKEGGKKEELSFFEQVTKKMDALFIASQQATAVWLKAAWVATPETILSFLYVLLHGFIKYILPSDLAAKFFCRYGEEWIPAISAKIDKVGGGVKKAADTAGELDNKIPGSQIVETGKRTLENVEKGGVAFVVVILAILIMINTLLLVCVVLGPVVVGFELIKGGL